MNRVLVAGVGNIFLADDAFGVEVASRLAAGPLPDGVEVGDFGIAGVHLAYQLLDGYRAAILLDAVPRGGEPGDIYVIEPEPGDEPESGVELDAHGMHPEAVLRMVEVLGGHLDRVMVVGCEPAAVEEGIGLSPRVAASVGPAVEVVRRLLEELAGEASEQGRKACYGS